jgi:hypothetical protein
MVLLPTANAVTKPREPEVLLMVATLVVPEVQVTELVRSCVAPLLMVPVAIICRVVPRAAEGDAGVIAREVSDALVTTNVDEPLCPPNAAVITDEPAAEPDATPRVPVVETNATAASEVDQVAC